MVRYLANLFLFRILLPVIITVCVLFRPSLFSFVYLLFMLLIPLVPVPSPTSLIGSTGIFIKIMLSITTVFTVIQAAFQISLFIGVPYANILEDQPTLINIFFYIGLAKLDGLTASYILIWIGPELLMFVTLLVFLCALKRINPLEVVEIESEVGAVDIKVKPPQSNEFTQYFVAVGRYVTLIMLCLAGVVRPSVEGGVYYLIFLGVATWWACYKQLKRGFAILLRCLIPMVALHFCALYIINFNFIQKYLPEDGPYARYFDLAPFVTTIYNNSSNSTNKTLIEATGDVNDRNFLYYFDKEITYYIYPIVLYFLYVLLVLESKELLKPEPQRKTGMSFGSKDGRLTRKLSARLSKQKLLTPTAAQKWQKASRKVRMYLERENAEASESTPLLRRPTHRAKSNQGRLIQDSTGSVTVTGEQEEIPLDVFGTVSVSAEEEEYDFTLFHQIIFALDTIMQYVVRSSYIATNIIMMAWSITYLSWITFVLLLWANIIWLIPNQRKRMLFSSPFLVVYALFLLISAYIYSLRLTDDELPQKIEGVDLGEIGFKKPEGTACIPLLVKSLYTVMFWITLRQFMHERMEKRQTSALADMVAPLQVTVGTATGVKKEPETGSSKFMTKLGKLINKFLIKFWIWVVAITLFAVAITGPRMTVFRILYMSLFLLFILSFQFSFRVWRKFMFGFWLTVIIYSMIILVLVYTYQFKKFPSYWTEYLHIQLEQQHDIGLEQYKTKQLFFRLVTPTFFVIVTVIQLHYFHDEFMKLTDPKRATNSQPEREMQETTSLEDSSMQGGAFMDRSRESTSKYYSEQDLEIVPSVIMAKWFEKALQVFYYIKHVFFLFLELHMLKIVLFFAMLMCIYDKCALYFIVVILAVFSLTFGRNLQIFTTYFTSVFVSVLILGRMIYQISYIDDKKWNVTCQITNNPKLNETVVNNGPWLGFSKLTEINESLPGMVQWNIIFIVVMTLWNVVDVRQYNYRLTRGRSTERRFFMFPKITREDADKNLTNFAKYMANYGFYKFGVEISFIFIVTLIGVRMDIYSLFHSIWLLILFSMPRRILSKVWVIYMMFIAISIPFQYFHAVGLPPSLCIEFPWDVPNPIFRDIQDWAFLLDNYTPPPVQKLVFDFMLLMAVSRQWIVFRIEKRYAGKDYAGGSNESIIHNAEQKDFVNPVPDYITYVRSYLDILKKAVLQSFLWITLAVVFWAGTSRVNIFSLGYLLCAFVFLWHGSDFYLRPIPKILRYWQRLLGYNVAVIFCKCCFQILGCIFHHSIPDKFCWLIQVLGITCVKNYMPLMGKSFIQIGVVADECVISSEGISWDVICFTMLILQKRLFNSYNFFHIVDDAKATAILASRGAELMEEMRLKTMKEQEETEKKVLEKIREKMERIKANQQKIQGDRALSTNHYVDSVSSDKPHYRVKPPATYKQAIRSGDYYMFDEVEDDEIDLLPEEKESFDEFDVGLTPYLGELLTSVVKDDINTALKQRSATMMETRETLRLRRQSSMPVDRRSSRPQLTTTFSAPPTIAEHEPKSVRIQDEPQPSTSQEREDEELSSLSEPKSNLGQKIFQILFLIWAFIDGLMINLTRFLNKYSRNYRIILKVLSKEKRILKDQTNYNIGVRIGTDQIWQPAGSYHSLLRNSKQESIHSDSDDDKPPISEDSDTKALAPSLPCSPEPDRRKASILTVPEIRILAASLERGLDSPCFTSRKSDEAEQLSPYVDYGDEMSSVDQPTIIRLMLACWYLIMSRSEIVCYFIIFFNQLRNSNLISLPLPLMVFFWGSLTIPRPSKTFWVTIIAYTEVVVLLKLIFQFDIMPGNRAREQTEFLTSVSERNPYYPPVLIGLHKQKDMQALWDLLLLLVVFFHRVLLKSMGIWSSTAPITAALLDDGEYKVVGEQLVAIESSEKDEYSDNEPSTSTPIQTSKSVGKMSSDKDEDVVIIKTVRLKKLNNIVISMRLGITKYAEEIKLFIQQLLDPTSRVTADVYSFMFLCDFINFFVILFGSNAFGTQQDGGVSAYLKDNRVPPLFLFMLIFQFMLIIIDRGIYLRKNILAKIVFQFVQIILLHIWLFILFPVVTKTSCNTLIPPQIYYIAKCSYLLLSAYQIRCGYPTRILGNFLCKGYGYINMFLFRGFMLVPFLFELRTCMDWMWTETSMAIFDWIKLEDIFQHIFLLKCSRNVEDEYPQPRAQEKSKTVKYLMGGALLTVIIGIIWFPLVFFSLGDAVGNPNPPSDVALEIRIGPYEPIYKMTVQSNSIFQFSTNQLEDLKSTYNAYQVSENFIFNYEADDLTAIKLNTDSANIWSISPPDRQRMLDEISSPKPLKIRLEYKVTHKTSKTEDSGIVPHAMEISMAPSTNESVNIDRENLLKMLKGENAKPVLFPYILPKFIKVTDRGTADPVNVLMLEKPDFKAMTYRNISIKLLSDNTSGYEQAWWKVKEVCDDYNYGHFLKHIAYDDCQNSIVLYSFNDKVFPPTLDIITSGGILTMYGIYFFFFHELLHINMFDCINNIWTDDMPNVDRILNICLAIYLVRELKIFEMEEYLYSKLIFIMRSRELCIRLSVDDIDDSSDDSS